MILDRIEQRAMYAGMGLGIPKALEYLARVDFAELPDGKHNIEGDRMFALVQRYTTKPVFKARWEIHKHYIDLQYLASGSERIGFASWNEGLEVDEPYNEQRDLGFYFAAGPLLTVSAGMFMLLKPFELHAPSLAMGERGEGPMVLKVVVKIRHDG